MASCAGCQAELPALKAGERLPRLATCPGCHAELHACRQCRFYDSVARRCRNPHVEEPPANHERANFCDYYEMGDPPPPPRSARDPFGDLFGRCP